MQPRRTSVITASFIAVAILCSLQPSHLINLEYSPRRAVLLKDPFLRWDNIGSDLIIIIAYTLLFVSFLLLFKRLRTVPEFSVYQWPVAAFMVFLIASGVSSALRTVSIWWPVYQFSVVLKVISAAAIFPAALSFFVKMPAFAKGIKDFLNLLLVTQLQGEQLLKSEEFLEQTNRLAGIGGWELNLLTKEVYWSTETHRIHGAAPGYIPTLAEGLERYAPSARATIAAAVKGRFLRRTWLGSRASSYSIRWTPHLGSISRCRRV